uniref:Uncharacterized protein n=1 Tax=Ascaris lumbricoides TaxID=6252 RepID=A0A0M3I095_ASCLU
MGRDSHSAQHSCLLTKFQLDIERRKVNTANILCRFITDGEQNQSQFINANMNFFSNSTSRLILPPRNHARSTVIPQRSLGEIGKYASSEGRFTIIDEK